MPEPSGGFTNFETEPLRPLALSGDGAFLYALNTPDDRLEVFAAGPDGLRSVAEARLGLRPIALTLRRAGELWVTNHLSDSVSVVDVSDPTAPKVIRSLDVGDEPRGIVAAGPDQRWVIVATAKRGDSLKAGIGRAHLWVFDGDAPERAPQVLTLFGAKPRALAVSPDGLSVYAGIFHSGNGTASVGGIEAASIDRAPVYSLDNLPPSNGPPKAGAIVRQVNDRWIDAGGRDWSRLVPFDLPDYDVFRIDLSGDRPTVAEAISGVGTVLFDIAVRPQANEGEAAEVWVSNSEAANLEIHEPRLRGRFAENRITRLRRNGDGWTVLSQDLNPHVDPARMPAPSALRARSLAQPLQIVFEPSGERAYVAAFGSRKVAVLSRDAAVMDRIDVGFGPAGLAHDASRQRLYVFNRLDASISVVDTGTNGILATVPLRHDPTPAVIKAGRGLLYDAAATSGQGTLSCASCHVFADVDGLGWDLGNPDGELVAMPEALQHDLFVPQQAFHPLKGPMMTQSLRGIVDTGPLHWRGDRFGRDSDQPGANLPSFMDFDRAFVDLMGLAQPPGRQEMEAFARFVHTIRYPPNPNEAPDRSYNSRQQAGFRIFNDGIDIDRGLLSCRDCHAAPLGTNGLINFEGADAGIDMKTAHLRNVYQKVGRFNRPGPQVSGFGLVHDGSIDTIINFLKLDVFHIPGKTEEERDSLRADLNAFVMAFNTGMAPAVGLQTTVSGTVDDGQTARLALMTGQAAAGDCDLIAWARAEGRERGWLWRAEGFLPDREGEVSWRLDDLLAHAAAAPVTFACVPPGDGWRSALDRDLDGQRDGDEPGPGNALQ
ncbi:YncE family protein [Pelagibius sp.]|uniref:YncE family protein n=1 Tax=Pelagibius sp. TaxID=1931238 RepID=UPI003B507C91